MTNYRAYRNCDAPAIAHIWKKQPPIRARFPTMTPALLEQKVFSKPYFDRHGLIVAEDSEGIVGFVHAGFGPDASHSEINYQTGVICMLVVSPDADQQQIGAELLTAAEAYLVSHGATMFLGGSLAPHNPFYLGMYGGTELPGVLAEDVAFGEQLLASGYQEQQQVLILQRDLGGFRPQFGREQMQIRRKYETELIYDSPPVSWWDACTVGQTQRKRIVLRDPAKLPCGTIAFWNIEPLASSWGTYATGLIELEIEPSYRRMGLGTFLVTETLRQLQTQGVSVVEMQTPTDNEAMRRLANTLGFQEMEQGVVFHKSAK